MDIDGWTETVFASIKRMFGGEYVSARRYPNKENTPKKTSLYSMFISMND